MARCFQLLSALLESQLDIRSHAPLATTYRTAVQVALAAHAATQVGYTEEESTLVSGPHQPAVAELWPAGQTMQLVCPRMSWYCPTGHEVQVMFPAEPASQLHK